MTSRLNRKALNAISDIASSRSHHRCVVCICGGQVGHLERGYLRQVADNFLVLLTVFYPGSGCSIRHYQSSIGDKKKGKENGPERSTILEKVFDEALTEGLVLVLDLG